MGDVDARYLAGTVAAAVAAARRRSPSAAATDTLVATAQAIYRRSVGRVDTCLYNGVAAGRS